MIIGYDASGKVLLISGGDDIGVMPTTWNGIAVTAHVLTPEQAEVLRASPDRGGLMFDGTSLTVLPPVPPPPPIDLSNIDNLEKTLKALALVMRDYTNALQAGTHTQKTIAQLKSDFAAKYNGLA